MKIAFIAPALAVIAALLLVVAGPATRFGAWEYGTGMLLLRWAFFVGVGAAVLAVVLLLVPQTRHGHGALLGLALLIGLGVAWVPWNGYRTAQSLPFIHDITTDTSNPPRFVDVVPLRADATNPADYPGDETARQQREAYPDIVPLELDVEPAQAMERALATAREMGWEIVAAAPEDRRIEATATTFWFGFKDDVVIRITPTESGSRLDIRSKSRVGRSDIGTNAERIREFTRRFADRPDSSAAG